MLANQPERRNHPRFYPQGLQAVIFVEADPELSIAGEVIDISCSGIKIRLDAPLVATIHGKIRIRLTLPRTGIPLNISGIVKHQQRPCEYGVRYENSLSPEQLDDFLFECVKLPRKR